MGDGDAILAGCNDDAYGVAQLNVADVFGVAPGVLGCGVKPLDGDEPFFL